MLLTETVRQLANEANLINVATEYLRSTGSWGTIHDYGNITVGSASLLMIRLDAMPSSGGGAFRLRIGTTNYVWGYYGSSGSYATHLIYAYVPSGTLNVLMECRSAAGLNSGVKNFKLGKANFSDESGITLKTYSSSESVTVASRVTPLGSLSKAAFWIMLWGKTPSDQTNFENVGDVLTNGVSLTVDGQQVNFYARNQDASAWESAYAVYCASLSVGSSHTFAISKRNANTEVHINIYASPWLLLPTDSEIWTLDLPQGSTLYLLLEPTHNDPTKYVKLGKARAISFGDSTDYYSTSSGTGLLTWNYTSETLNPLGLVLVASADALGGCISSMAIDVR